MAESPRFMVIDDQEELTDSLKLGLSHKGVNVDAYNDPVEAIKDFRAGLYDVVILDINMPGRMNGFDVYRELAKIDMNVRIFFLTAFDVYEREFKRLFPEVTVERFLKKPITIQALIEEVYLQQSAVCEENKS